jgi:hypothetical protein
MSPKITFDMSGLEDGIRATLEHTRRTLPQVVNQASLNVAGRTFDALPPQSGTAVEAKRAEVRAYLMAPVATRLKIYRFGKRKGQFGKRGSRENQLQRVHLIIQARRRRAGLKGLYGQAMRRASGAFKQRASVSVGFEKSIWVPIIRGLNPLCRFKFPFWKTHNIARWPGSAGYGVALPAKPGLSPECILTAGANYRSPGQIGQPMVEMESRALQAAISAEGAEMIRHAEEMLKKEAA